jgi:acetylserotonin N-methyltransferase
MSFALPSCDDRPIWDIWLSSLWLPSVTVASELGVFDALAQGPSRAAALAEKLDLEARGCETLLRMLVALDLAVLDQGQFQLTPVARQYLVTSDPFFWGHVWPASAGSSPEHARLRDALRRRSGRRSEDRPGPLAAWESGQIDPELAGRIARFMNSHSMAAAAGLARNGDFRSVRRLLDVGGGSGCFAIALAAARPDLRCTVMDLPAMCRVAEQYIAAAGAREHVDTVSIDMFREAWPRGYDALFFSNVFHDWSFETCAELAGKAREVLPSGGSIYLHEMLLNDTGTGPRTAAAFSMLMLGGTRGQQFTFAELRDLLATAGFTDVATSPGYGYYSLIRGRRP